MMIKQILLSLPTYPDRPPLEALEGAALLARYLGAGLTAQVPQLGRDPSRWPPIIGTFPLDFPKLMNDCVMQSEANAATLSDDITRICGEFAVNLDLRRSLSTLYPKPDFLVDLARLHDLTVLPVPQIDNFDRAFVEAAIFDTGRPTLLLPSGRGRKALNWLDKVVVAFDYGREAARALNDSLPLLTRAKEVHVVCITGEKDFHTTCSRADLEKYFTAQGISPVIETAPANGGIVAALNDYASAVDADLLVMGAYGHSRIREFILGGATAGILGDPKLPVLMSR